MNDSLGDDGLVPAASTGLNAQEAPGAGRALSGANAVLVAVGRVLLAVPFVYAGLFKIEHYSQTGALMRAHGVPPVLLPLVIALEVGGGVALGLGGLTRLTAGALAVFSVAAISIFLLPDPTATTLAVVEFAMVGGLCAFVAHGGGRFSLDGAWMCVRAHSRRTRRMA